MDRQETKTSVQEDYQESRPYLKCKPSASNLCPGATLGSNGQFLKLTFIPKLYLRLAFQIVSMPSDKEECENLCQSRSSLPATNFNLKQRVVEDLFFSGDTAWSLVHHTRGLFRPCPPTPMETGRSR